MIQFQLCYMSYKIDNHQYGETDTFDQRHS